MRYTFIIFCMLSGFNLFGQDWIRIYGTEHYWATPFDIGETYDHGFLIGTNFRHTQSTYEEIGLLKTDINGNKLYEKKIGEPYSYDIHNGGLIPTIDGGVIISGQIFSQDYNGDPFIIKLDPCYNVQWCKIFNTPNLYDWSGDVKYMPWDSSYVFILFNHLYDLENKRISLMKMSWDGEIIWENLYCTNPLYRNENPFGIEVSLNDSSVILYGSVNVLDTTAYSFRQPYWSKINSNGEMLWEQFAVYDSIFLTGVADQVPMINDTGAIIAPVTDYITDKAFLCYIDSNGNFINRTEIYKPDSVDHLHP